MADKSVIVNIEARETGRSSSTIGDGVRLGRELTAERDALKIANRAQEERIRALDAEVAGMQLAEGLSGGGRNRAKARARVNRLMREVDRCIALLENPKGRRSDDTGRNRDNAR